MNLVSESCRLPKLFVIPYPPLSTVLQHMAGVRLHHQPYTRTAFQVKRLASARGEVHLEFRATIYLRDHSNIALLHRGDDSCQHIASAESLRRSGGHEDIAGANSDSQRLQGIDARQWDLDINRRACNAAGHGSLLGMRA